MNWANLDHKYTRDLSKWVPLCKKCHSAYDQEHFKVYSGLKGTTHKRHVSDGVRGFLVDNGGFSTIFVPAEWDQKPVELNAKDK
jgi:hypothetical protein